MGSSWVLGHSCELGRSLVLGRSSVLLGMAQLKQLVGNRPTGFVGYRREWEKNAIDLAICCRKFHQTIKPSSKRTITYQLTFGAGELYEYECAGDAYEAGAVRNGKENTTH